MPREDDRLAEEAAALGASDVEGIAEPPEVPEGQLVFGTGKGVGQTRAVQIEGQSVCAAEAAQRFQLGQGIQRAELGRMRQVNRAGHDKVIAVLVLLPAEYAALHIRGAELAALLRQGDDLVAAAFHGAGLVHADMAAVGGDDPLPGLQQGGEHQGVALRAAREEKDIGLRGRAGLADLLAGCLGKGVGAVARGGHQVVLKQALKHGRVRPLHVIGCKIQFFRHG